MKPRFIILALTAIVGCAGGAPRPNVVLCMADDLGRGGVGYYGAHVVHTPNLDRMADEGVRFDRFYAAAPVCSPTRASCLTGRHPYRTGVFRANSGILRPEELALSEVLRANGYATGHFGKWHLGTFAKTGRDANRGGARHPELYNPPTLHGFDVFFSTESKVPTWDPLRMPATFAPGESRKRGWDALEPGEPGKPYGTAYWTPAGQVETKLPGDDSRLIMDRALSFVETSVRAKKPFLAVVWFHAPHLPNVAGPEFASRIRTNDVAVRRYAGAIAAMDEQMGRLRRRLRELGVERDTMIWFCSDNGPERATPGATGGLRGRKRSLYEGGIRVPGLLVWPAGVPQPKVVDEPVVTSDYLPTILAAAGIAWPENANRLDGVDVLPLLKGKPFRRPEPIRFAFAGQEAVVGKRYKFYRAAPDAAPELYDLLADPGETHDIAAARPEVVAECRRGFARWIRSVRDSFEGKEYGTASFDRLEQGWPSARK